jgi:hypothetical protein
MALCRTVNPTINEAATPARKSKTTMPQKHRAVYHVRPAASKRLYGAPTGSEALLPGNSLLERNG